MIWKAVVFILNFRFTADITYHNFIHRLRVVCGTGMATLKLELLQQVVAFMEKVLRAIFLDLYKAYNALGSLRGLGILEGYGVVIRALHLLRLYWARLIMVARAGGY